MPASEQEWQEFRDRAARAASKGAALIDRGDPEWFRKIDTAHLEMQYCDKCVLGQVFRGEYGDGLLALRLSEINEQDCDYGFSVTWTDCEYFGESAWMELGRCWREEIRRREADHG